MRPLRYAVVVAAARTGVGGRARTDRRVLHAWFSAQNLLPSGQFLDQFLANPGDLRRFLPGSSGTPAEAQMLRALVDLFPVCGTVATLATLIGGLTPWRWAANLVLALAGVIPLVGWAGGITRLPPGANAEVGLWLIAASSVAVLAGLILDLALGRSGD
jgi:hypothetical protein